RELAQVVGTRALRLLPLEGEREALGVVLLVDPVAAGLAHGIQAGLDGRETLGHDGAAIGDPAEGEVAGGHDHIVPYSGVPREAARNIVNPRAPPVSAEPDPHTPCRKAREGTEVDMSDNNKPTIVLVHGAWADGSSWNAVISPLQAEGYTVMAPPNLLRSLPDDAAYIASF